MRILGRLLTLLTLLLALPAGAQTYNGSPVRTNNVPSGASQCILSVAAGNTLSTFGACTGSGGASSVTGTNGVSVSPTTGAVVVSLSSIAGYNGLCNPTGSTASPIACAKDTANALDWGCATTVNQSGMDSGPCLQATLNAAAAQNVCAHLPGGIYYLGTRINWPANGACIRGDGWNLTTAGVGTYIHVISANFASGGPSAGNDPIEIGASAGVENVWIDGIAFTEDQPADTAGWAPINYGPLIAVSNGSIAPKFTNIYAAGVNYFLNLHNVQGYWLQNFYADIYTTGVQIDHNADYQHVSHVNFNDYFCSITNCPNITAYQQTNAVGFQSNRNDNANWSDTKAFGLQTLFAFGTDASGVSDEFTILDADCDKCQQVMLVSAVGVNGKSYGLLNHSLNFAGTVALSNSNLINIASTSTGDVLQFSDMRCEDPGDSCITDLGSSNSVILGGSFYATHWGSNSTTGSCAAIYAIAANNTANGNTLQGQPNLWSFSAGCSSLTFSAVTAGPVYATTLSAGGGGFSVSSNGSATTTQLLSIPKWTINSTGCSAVGAGACGETGNVLDLYSGSLLSIQLDLHQHARIGGVAAATIASGACGTGSNGTISGNDQSGVITIGAATTTTCAISFANQFATVARSVHLTAANAGAATAISGEYVSALSTSGFTITGTLASTTWYYWVQ